MMIWQRQAEAEATAARDLLDAVPGADGDAVGAQVLATLAAAGEPLTVEMLTRLAGLTDPDPVRRWCDGAYRPLLAVEGSRYGIADPRVRALLPDTAHTRIAEDYLDRWGGLDAGLPALAAGFSAGDFSAGDFSTGDFSAADVDGGYPIRHLVGHLERAGRVDDLHRLLTCTAQTGSGPVNLWFEAQYRSGSLDDYLRCLERARDRAADVTDADLAAGRPAPSLAREFRYALMRASAEQMSRPLDPVLWQGLLATGSWDGWYALSHARRLHRPEERCAALLVAQAHLPPEHRPAVVAEALDAVRGSPDELPSKALVRMLAPHLTEALLEELLIAAALGPDGGYGDDEVLIALAPYLPTTLLGRALEAITVLGGDGFEHRMRAESLIAYLPYLPATLLAGAETIAAAIDDPYHRAEALTAVLPHLPPTRRAEVSGLAVAAARSVPRAAGRLLQLAALLPLFPADRRPVLLAEILEGARALPGDDRGRVLAALVPHTPEVLPEALAAVRAAPADEFRTRLLLELAAHLDDGPAAALVAEILDDIDFSSPYHRDLVPPALLARVLAGHPTTEDTDLTLLLHGLATHLSDAERTTLLDTQLDELLAEIEYESHFSIQLDSWLPHLPEAMVERILAAVRATYGSHSDAFKRLAVQLAPYLSGAAQRELLPLVLAKGARCGPTLATMIGRLPASEREGFVAAALATAGEHGHHGALAVLAAYLPADRHRALHAQAWRPRRDAEHAPVLAALDAHRTGRVPFVIVDRDHDGVEPRTVELVKRAYRQHLADRPAAEIAGTLRRLTANPGHPRDAWRHGLVTIAAVGAAFRELGGDDAVREYVDAVTDCYRWWP